MKRLLTIILVLVCCCTCSINVQAQENTTTQITYFDDGSYSYTEITELNNAGRSNVKKGKKDISYYNNSGKLQWTVTVTGTFNYTGKTSKCTSASVSVSNIASNWKLVSKNASYSKNAATGTATMKYKNGKTTTRTVKLSCSAKGVLS